MFDLFFVFSSVSEIFSHRSPISAEYSTLRVRYRSKILFIRLKLKLMRKVRKQQQQQVHFLLVSIVHPGFVTILSTWDCFHSFSGVQVVLLSAPMKYQFSATYPFLFFIRDVSLDGFLFEGVIASPDKVAASEESISTPAPNSPPKNIYYPRPGGSQSNGRKPPSSTTPRYLSSFSNRNSARSETRQFHSNGQNSRNYPYY